MGAPRDDRAALQGDLDAALVAYGRGPRRLVAFLAVGMLVASGIGVVPMYALLLNWTMERTGAYSVQFTAIAAGGATLIAVAAVGGLVWIGATLSLRPLWLRRAAAAYAVAPIELREKLRGGPAAPERGSMALVGDHEQLGQLSETKAPGALSPGPTPER